ncbi:MAG: hypothetical protein ACOVO0_05555, partial [Burkholderiaceae bacterium]
MKLFIDMSPSELPKRPIMRRLAVGVMLVVSVCAAAAQNLIQAVTGQYRGGLEVLTIKAQDVISVDPVGFSTQTPARIAFDFVGFGSSVDRGAIPLDFKNAKSATVIQANGRTRVVINLQHAAPYMIARSGSSFEIQLADVGMEPPAKSVETVSSSVTSD